MTLDEEDLVTEQQPDPTAGPEPDDLAVDELTAVIPGNAPEVLGSPWLLPDEPTTDDQQLEEAP